MEAPPHIPRSRPGPRLPHRRSKAQRDRQRGPSPANSLSSSPEPAVWPRPQRKRKRRKRGDESVILREEDLIDGFCISSYGSLEAMQRDVSMESVPLEEPYRKRPSGKRKRSDGGSSEDPGASENQPDERAHKSKKRHCFAVGSITSCTRPSGPERETHQDCLRCCLDAGYICDAESSSEEQVPGDDLAVSFTISTASPPLSGGRIKLTVFSHISGLGRSCEKSQEPEMEYIPATQPLSVASSQEPAIASPKVEPVPVQPPPPPPSVEPGVSSSSRSSAPKPLPAAPPAPALSQRPTPPSISLPVHTAPSALPSVLRPPSHHHMNLFATQALPPPPPLLQVPGHPPSAVLSEHNIIGQEMGSRFLAAPGSAAEIGAAVRPMYQFHQHNHQHTHQHTHQHFTPYPHNFEKYPGKIENLYRQNPSSFFPPFSPVITALPPVLPPSVSFGSLQGAFQPKSTSSELASRCSVPPPMPHKAPRITEQFKPRRSGRWCAMHVRVAYMILRHQERMKLAHGNPHKPEFRSDLLCLNAGLSPLPTTHELAQPASLLTGAVSHAPAQFQVAPSAATFLSQAGPSDPFLRAPGLSALASLTNGAFGGLGNPSYNSSPMFNHKEAPIAHSFPNPHDHWNRLHRTPPTFPAPPPQICGKVGDMDLHGTHIKDEKERDLLYSRLAPRVSPLTTTQRLPGSEERSSSRTLSPYITIRPGSSSDMKPRLTPDHPSKVKVKEEPELLSFEVGRSTLPGLHLSHPSPPFERLRGAFLGEQYPNALEAWRDVYRRADPPPLRLPPAPSQRLYEQREERAHILREDFERARIYGLPSHVTMQPAAPSMLGALYPHPATGLLCKTPPINLLSAPPPLISTSRPGSPPRRDLFKDRDCR
ncbi:probable fibrosin-1 isoform X2 [Dendropsophus ebraccatus]|uniref:probable fibrosin-1 isoform X2 n=1 Tax=Dendropsophus ebraccatus TaxID=150705 RepID=UPI003830FD92